MTEERKSTAHEYHWYQPSPHSFLPWNCPVLVPLLPYLVLVGQCLHHQWVMVASLHSPAVSENVTASHIMHQGAGRWPCHLFQWNTRSTSRLFWIGLGCKLELEWLCITQVFAAPGVFFQVSVIDELQLEKKSESLLKKSFSHISQIYSANY